MFKGSLDPRELGRPNPISNGTTSKIKLTILSKVEMKRVILHGEQAFSIIFPHRKRRGLLDNQDRKARHTALVMLLVTPCKETFKSLYLAVDNRSDCGRKICDSDLFQDSSY